MPVDITTVSMDSLLLVASLGFLLLVLPRQYALAPILIGACYLTLGQAIIINGVHFYLIRVLIAFGLVRLLVRKEIFSIKLNAIDKVLIAWIIVRTFLYVVISGETESISVRLGAFYNTIGVYSLVRAVVRDFEDIIFTVKILAIIVIPLAAPFLIEYITGRNPFFIIGGVPEFSDVRDGRPRCQGPFLHSILAGTFGATAMPLFVGLWKYGTGNRFIALVAIAVSTLIVFVSSSGGPLIAYLVVLLGFLCWMFKSRIREIRWGIAILLITLQAVMQAPVWFLISRLSGVFGGAGYYRSALIDTFIKHFDEWWLIGTENTAHWMATGIMSNPKMADIVNNFIVQGITGGLLCLILFIWLFVQCFKITGKAIQDEVRFSSSERVMIWALGCTVLGHVVSFFSVSYFDQINVFLCLIMGMIGALTQDEKSEEYETESQKLQGAMKYPA